jgi:hypothetical protein
LENDALEGAGVWRIRQDRINHDRVMALLNQADDVATFRGKIQLCNG